MTRPPVDDVEQALHSPVPLTRGQVKYIFSRQFEWHEEQYLVAAIKKYLLTRRQREGMHVRRFSIEDMLNGRIEGLAAQNAAQEIFNQWNARLGFRAFGS